MCSIGDFVGLVKLKEWMKVLGLVDVEQLKWQVQLVEEGQRKQREEVTRMDLRERRVSKDLTRDRLAWKSKGR